MKPNLLTCQDYRYAVEETIIYFCCRRHAVCNHDGPVRPQLLKFI
jgi:hypothetical protein